MLRIPLVLAAVLAILSTSEAFVPPAGKCRDITPLPIDYNGLKYFQQWRVLYYPVGEPFNSVDSANEEISLDENNDAHGIHRMRMKNNTVSLYEFKLSYESDNVIYEEATDDNGRKLMFKSYVLHIVPGELTLLYCRCSETGSLDYDTRYISIVSGNTLSAAEEQELITKDASYNFTGGIQKLDNKLQ